MANAYYGHTILGELADGLSVPTDGAADNCTQMVYVGNETGGNLWMYIYCNSAITVATGEEFLIQFVSYSSDTIASATSPFSNSNAGGQPNATGTAEADALCYPVYNTSAQGAVAWSAGDLILEFGIPDTMLRLLSHDYVGFTIECDDSDGTGKVDAFIVARV